MGLVLIRDFVSIRADAKSDLGQMFSAKVGGLFWQFDRYRGLRTI